MNSYYKSLLEEIEKNIQEEKYDLAWKLIEDEQAMPYVPEDVSNALQDYKKTCLPYQKKEPKSLELDALVHGNQRQQELAVSMMKSYNLRQYQDEVQTLLNSDLLLDEIKGELIEYLMEQKINSTYSMKKSGLEISFIPDVIPTQEEDQTIVETKRIFELWFENDNPTFLNFCNRLLEQEILESRPFDFTEVEAMSLAVSIVKLVSESFGQSEEFAAFIQLHQLQDIVAYPLLIERRGDNNEK